MSAEKAGVPAKSPARATPSKAPKPDEDVVVLDDELAAVPCSVCGKPDEDGFILCETCDEGGGHFSCLGLEGVPEGEWFCAKCAEAGKGKEKAEADAAAAAASPGGKATPKGKKSTPKGKGKGRGKAAAGSDDDDEDFDVVEDEEDDDYEEKMPTAKSRSRGGGKAAAAAAAADTAQEDAARAAWAAIETPVTEETFVRWYCATHGAAKPGAKRPAASPAAAPAAKAAKKGPGGGQALLPGASAPAMPASKAKALLKGIVTTAKAAAKAKRWHHGDATELTGMAVMDPADFAALFRAHPSVKLAASSGVVTTFSLNSEQLAAVFGDAIGAVKVPTFSRPRAFCKGYKTGDAALSFNSAEGKYSKGTSTLTVKFRVRAGEGREEWGFDSDDGM